MVGPRKHRDVSPIFFCNLTAIRRVLRACRHLPAMAAAAQRECTGPTDRDVPGVINSRQGDAVSTGPHDDAQETVGSRGARPYGRPVAHYDERSANQLPLRTRQKSRARSKRNSRIIVAKPLTSCAAPLINLSNQT